MSPEQMAKVARDYAHGQLRKEAALPLIPLALGAARVAIPWVARTALPAIGRTLIGSTPKAVIGNLAAGKVIGDGIGAATKAVGPTLTSHVDDALKSLSAAGKF